MRVLVVLCLLGLVAAKRKYQQSDFEVKSLPGWNGAW